MDECDLTKSVLHFLSLHSPVQHIKLPHFQHLSALWATHPLGTVTTNNLLN